MTPPEPFKVWTDGDGVQRYLHGTKADLKPGDVIEAGRASNYGERRSAAFVYLIDFRVEWEGRPFTPSEGRARWRRA